MKMLFPLLLALCALPLPAGAAGAAGQAAAVQSAVMSDGVVRKIDAANGRVTLRHGPLLNLDMPAMTMVFQARPPALLEAVKVGDTVKFHAEEIDGVLTVTVIQVAR